MNSFIEVLNEEKEKGLEVIENCDIKLLIGEVLSGKPVIAEIQWNRYITHYVVIRGVKGNIKVVDPLDGYRSMYSSWLERAIDLGHGKKFFSLEPK